MAKAFRYALKHSLPILISYIPVALAYGVLMQNCGYNFVWSSYRKVRDNILDIPLYTYINIGNCCFQNKKKSKKITYCSF